MVRTGRNIVTNVLERYEQRFRVSISRLYKKQRETLPVQDILKNQQIPLELIEQWENDFINWFIANRKNWELIWDRSVRRARQESKQIYSQEIFDDWILQRAAVIGGELALVNTVVMGKVLELHATGSVQNLSRELKKNIGINSRQFNAFTKQAFAIDKRFPDDPDKAKAIKDRLFNKKLNYRAQLIARNEISEAVNFSQIEDIKNRIALGELPLAMEKFWSNVGDNDVSEGCLENTADGWIDIDAVFTSGDLAPPRFPGCRCGLKFRPKPGSKLIFKGFENESGTKRKQRIENMVKILSGFV